MKPATITRDIRAALKLLAEARYTASWNAQSATTLDEINAFRRIETNLQRIDGRLSNLLAEHRDLLTNAG
jgi:hypothetical protein